MGWLVLVALIAVSLGALWAMDVRRGMLTAAAASLLIGASGYALQGRPSLPAAPTHENEAAGIVPLTGARHAFFGEFSGAETWLRMSEALAAHGNGADAVGILQNAVRRYPGDAQLWIGLGNALVDHAHGLTPPAEYAYRRAAALNRPAAEFFYGVALARSGDRDGALTLWRDVLANAPAGTSWRPLVESGVVALSASKRPNS